MPRTRGFPGPELERIPMQNLIHRLVTSWLGTHGSKRRPAPSPAPGCESLEGRQLLSTSGLYRGGAVVPTSQANQLGQTTARGMMLQGGGVGQRGNSLAFSQTTQG